MRGGGCLAKCRACSSCSVPLTCAVWPEKSKSLPIFPPSPKVSSLSPSPASARLSPSPSYVSSKSSLGSVQLKPHHRITFNIHFFIFTSSATTAGVPSERIVARLKESTPGSLLGLIARQIDFETEEGHLDERVAQSDWTSSPIGGSVCYGDLRIAKA